MAELTAVEKLKEWAEKNREVLAGAKVETIIGTYSGSGDDGLFEEVSFAPGEGELSDELRDEAAELMEAVHDEVASPGYGNDDGGGGDLTLVVATGKILHSEYYYTTTREYTIEDHAI